MGTKSRRAPVVLRLEGTFDVPAARRVERAIEAAGEGDAVTVDLSQVREFQDFGVAVLAQALKHARAVKVGVQGLRHHQARLLRYFGVDAERFAPRPVLDPS